MRPCTFPCSVLNHSFIASLVPLEPPLWELIRGSSFSSYHYDTRGKTCCALPLPPAVGINTQMRSQPKETLWIQQLETSGAQWPVFKNIMC